MKYRKFDAENGKTYYVPVDHDFPHAADEVLIDTHNPSSRGFGGSLFHLETTEGTVDDVRGPWHGGCPYDVAQISELHRTKVTILRDAHHIPYSEWGEWDKWKAGNKKSIAIRFRMTGQIIIDEQEWVMGHYARGDRIAQQLANLWNEPLWVHVQSFGGSHSHEVRPGRPLHPMARRKENRHNHGLSTEQSYAVES